MVSILAATCWLWNFSTTCGNLTVSKGATGVGMLCRHFAGNFTVIFMIFWELFGLRFVSSFFFSKILQLLQYYVLKFLLNTLKVSDISCVIEGNMFWLQFVTKTSTCHLWWIKKFRQYYCILHGMDQKNSYQVFFRSCLFMRESWKIFDKFNRWIKKSTS